MLRWLIIALLVVPLADILLLIWVAGQIGAVATVALVVLTALIGLMLVRAEGRHTLRKLQRRAAAGEVPTNELLDGALLIAAGAFLLTPGLVTDAVGLLLVIPLTRVPLRVGVKRWIAVPFFDGKTGGFVTGRVYTAGAPFGGESAEGSGDETVDLGEEAYHIDLEESDEPPNGNA
jgi:UPF0716 protein FxsA